MSDRRGFSFVEILLGLAVLAALSIPILGLLSGGRRTTEFNVRALQALCLGQAVMEEVSRAALLRFDSLPSDPVPVPLSAAADGTSAYLGFLAGPAETVEARLPGIGGALEDFQIQVTVTPVDELVNARAVDVTVQYRLSPAHPTWHRVALQTIVARRSPF